VFVDEILVIQNDISALQKYKDFNVKTISMNNLGKITYI